MSRCRRRRSLWWGSTRACDPCPDPRWASLLVRSTAAQARPVPPWGRGRAQGSTRWLPGMAARVQGGVQGPNLQRSRLALPPSGSASNFLSNALPPLPYLGAIFAAGSLTLCLAEFPALPTGRRGSFKNSKLLARPPTRSVPLLKCVQSAIPSQSISP